MANGPQGAQGAGAVAWMAKGHDAFLYQFSSLFGAALDLIA